jgi:tetratricopeptide (TPR) repeat protein
MFALPILLAPMLIAAPLRERETPTVSWVGKTVYPKASGLQLDVSAEPSDVKVMPGKIGVAVNMISYRVYAERAEHIQTKTREGIAGWLRKSDVVPLEDAVAFFTKQVDANPRDLNAFNRRAAAWRAKGELEAALLDMDIAIKLGPSAALFNNRALIWQAMKDYDKANADYNQALAMFPNYALALTNRAGMWHGKKDYDKAIADASQALQFEQRIPNAYRIRGIAWTGKKEYDKAIADLTKSLEIDPKSGQAHADRANAWAAKKDHAKAKADFDDALKLEPNNVGAAADMALWLASCPDAKYRDGKRALEVASQAHKTERSNSRAIQALAAAHAELGRFDEAIRWQEHALGDRQLKEDTTARQRLDLYRQQKPYRRD